MALPVERAPQVLVPGLGLALVLVLVMEAAVLVPRVPLVPLVPLVSQLRRGPQPTLNCSASLLQQW